MLEFNVKNQTIIRTDDFEAVSDSRNYLTAKFTFTEEWTGEKTAIFGYEGRRLWVLLEDDACIVPWEVIKPPFFTVSVFCGDRITAGTATVEVEKSGYTDGEAPKQPEPDIYTQILKSVMTPYIGENGNWYVWDKEERSYIDSDVKAQGIQGEKGEDGYTPVRGTDYWTEADKTELKAYIDEAILGGMW